MNIVIKEFPDRQFSNKQDMFTALRENKSFLIAQKKSIVKHADPVFSDVFQDDIVISNKAESQNIESVDTLNLVLAINTCNLFDSHADVHFDGTWNKSAKESKGGLLLNSHKMVFENIIGDGMEVSVKRMSWKKLGFDFDGTTEVLVFSGNIDKSRNEYMFKQYQKGYVKEHSVGMRYVKLDLAINSESKWDAEEKAVWDKYYPKIVNKEAVDERGYFWAVTEAKIVEGSAVVKGSNYATPVISIEAVSNDTSEEKEEPTEEVTQTSTKVRRRI